jgi:hypothetical protein
MDGLRSNRLSLFKNIVQYPPSDGKELFFHQHSEKYCNGERHDHIDN